MSLVLGTLFDRTNIDRHQVQGAVGWDIPNNICCGSEDDVPRGTSAVPLEQIHIKGINTILGQTYEGEILLVNLQRAAYPNSGGISIHCKEDYI